jgi:hypothetical protein
MLHQVVPQVPHLIPPPSWRAVALPAVDAAVPALAVRLHDGQVAEIPGDLWPQMAYRAANKAGASGAAPGVPLVSVVEAARDQVNELLEAWEHPLGGFRRLFAQQHFVMVAGGEPVAVACSGSVRRPTVAGGIPRRSVVELARIARHPDHPRAMRAMLRVWTDYLAPAWSDKYDDWPVTAAISYALPGKTGNVYRFDGWDRIGETNPWGGSTGWGNPSKADQIANGRKVIWLYRYPDPNELVPPA